MLRKALFQLHWLVGLAAGSVLAMVGATGAVLSFENELLRWMNPGVISIARQAAQPLAPHALLARLAVSHPDRRVASLTVSHDASRAVRVVFADREARYVDPYTAAVSSEPRGAGFFRLVEQVHRRLAAGELGKQVVGACTLGLIMLCLSGLCLRWQRKRPGTLRHLHTLLGTWLLAVYLLAGLTGLYWSYGWYRDGLYALSGTARPQAAQAAPGSLDLARGWSAFQREVASYQSVTLQLPQRAAQALELRYLDAGAPHGRAFSRLALEPASGAVLRHERYADLAIGSRLLRSIFALHSGSFFGLTGVLAIMLASLCMPFFAISGWVMYLRRARRRARPAVATWVRQPVARAAARSAGALLAIAMHGVAAFALLTYEPARAALFAAAPIMVHFVTPPKVEPQPKPPVEIVPPKPKPRPRPKPIAKPRPKPPEPQRVLAAPVEVPAPVVAPFPPPPEPEPAPPPVIAAAPPAPAPVVPVTAPVFNAAYLNNPAPAYPPLSRRAGEQGRVLLRVLVNASGSADDVQIRDSSGHARLDDAARETVRRWRFAPAKRGEQPVAAWVLIPISFRLEG